MPPAPTVATDLQRSSTIPLGRGRDSIATSGFDGLWTSGRLTFLNRPLLSSRIRLDANAVIDG